MAVSGDYPGNSDVISGSDESKEVELSEADSYLNFFCAISTGIASEECYGGSIIRLL